MPRPEIQRSAMLGSHSLWKGGVIFLVQLVGPVAPEAGATSSDDQASIDRASLVV